MRPGIPFGIGLFFILFSYGVSSADIYRYKDEDGVWHFTNVQSAIKENRRYRLYLRTPRKKPSDYIKEYEGIILEASKKFGVDGSLIKAVIRGESNFDHDAVSSTGAKGLMQLMPETANTMEVKDPFSPEENIFGGTRYLSLLLKQFQNNKELALAAYNAGPEAVEKYQGIPPYPETRIFVEKVLEYYKHYASKGD